MAEVVVRPDVLRRYAGLLEDLSEEPSDKLRKYISTHCADKDGMEGWLAGAKKPIDKIADISTKGLDNVSGGMAATAGALDRAADCYTQSDNESAKWIFSTVAETVPKSYREIDPSTDTIPSFPGKLNVELPAPKKVKKAEEYRKRFREDLADANEWIKATTGHDVLAELLKVVLPEWGCLDRIGEAYGHGRDWYVDASAHIDEGMNALAPHWTDGDASAAFEYYIRVRWRRYLDYRTMHMGLATDYLPYWSKGFDLIIGTLAEAVLAFTSVIDEAIATAKSLDASEFWEAARGIAQMAVALIKLVRVALKFLDKSVDLLDEAVDILFDSLELGAARSDGTHIPPSIPDPGQRPPTNSKVVSR